MSAVLDRVPGQDAAVAFLKKALLRPHHAYVFAGPEGCGKRLAAQAFAASLLCPDGGCGDCRACRLTLDEKHPNTFVVEPEGRDIRVDAVREVRYNAFRTSPEPGPKVFLIREADRLNSAAADVLLKVLEEPPGDAVLLLMSARPHELPDTVLSRCHVVTLAPLAEDFVVRVLEEGGAGHDMALLCARLAGGNLGRARRLANSEEGLWFRDVARAALEDAMRGPAGAVTAADAVLSAAERFKRGLKAELEREVAAFTDEQGRPDESFRGVISRIEERHKRRMRRAERDYVDWVLLAGSSILRDRVLASVGGDAGWRVNLDLETPGGAARASARGLGAMEEARAALADETNLNTRLVLERAFLQVARSG